jgi:Glycosyl hydrolases family 28/Pectate lyase superfamily protein
MSGAHAMRVHHGSRIPLAGVARRRDLLALALPGAAALLPVFGSRRPARAASTGGAPSRRTLNSGTWRVTEFGAVGDGKTLGTRAIQSAIDACAKAGGGVVVVPAGRFLTAPIFLRSNVELHLTTGATLLATRDKALYPSVDGRNGGVEQKLYASLITGKDLENIAITGNGTVDGDGFHWVDAEQETVQLRKKLGMPKAYDGLLTYPEGAPLRYPRPRLVNLIKCVRVNISGLTLEQTPHYNVHLVYCDDVQVTGIRVKGVDKSRNATGIVVDSCRNVRISGCTISSGDDGITLKAGFGEDGRRVSLDCADVIVQHCTFLDSDGAGVAIGSETAGGIHDLVVSDCVMDNLKWGFRLKTNRGRGGVVENVRLSNLIIDRARRAGMDLTAWHDVSMFPDRHLQPGTAEETPIIRNIDISDVTISRSAAAWVMRGLPERPFEQLSFRSIACNRTETGVSCEYTAQLTFDDVTMAASRGPSLVVKSTRELELSRVRCQQPPGDTPLVELEEVTGAHLDFRPVPAGIKRLIALKGARNTGIVVQRNHFPDSVLPRAPGVVSIR